MIPPCLPIARLLLVGMLVPAVFSALDHWLLGRLVANPRSHFVIVETMAAFVVQVGVLGVLCGRMLESPWWRWGVYAWGWLLIDIQVFSALDLVESAGWWWNNSQYLLLVSLLAAQVALAIICGILGAWRWTIRWPLCAAAAVLLSIPLVDNGLANELLPIGIPALIALCLALRFAGFRLDLAERPADEATTRPAAAPANPQSLQFGVRHVLIWTTSLAIVLGVLRALDLLRLNALIPMVQSPILSLLTAGAFLALLFIVAMWTAVGAGSPWLRWPALAMTMAAAGLVCAALEYMDRGGNLFRLFVYTIAADDFWRQNGWIMAWMVLAGGLIAAAMLILRTIGYRLVRRTKPSVAARAKDRPLPVTSRAVCEADVN